MPRLTRSCRRRVRGALVLLGCLGLPLPILLSVGGGSGDVGRSVVLAARAHLGENYVWGATGPGQWDCSGLTSVLWRRVGGAGLIPRTAAEQQAWAVPIPAAQLRKGDLVFFGAPVTHVGVYAGQVDGVRYMVDASSSRGMVVERPIWTTGVVRYGRVPRRGMPHVKPWQPPPPPVPAPAPVVVRHRPAPVAAGAPAPLRGLPRTPHGQSPFGRRAAHAAAWSVGARGLSDVALVRQVWAAVGGPALPTTRAALVARARPVALAQVQLGDLVVYGRPAAHVGIYVGSGRMVDTLGDRVVVRRVYAAPGVRLERLRG